MTVDFIVSNRKHAGSSRQYACHQINRSRIAKNIFYSILLSFSISSEVLEQLSLVSCHQLEAWTFSLHSQRPKAHIIGEEKDLGWASVVAVVGTRVIELSATRLLIEFSEYVI